MASATPNTRPAATAPHSELKPASTLTVNAFTSRGAPMFADANTTGAIIKPASAASAPDRPNPMEAIIAGDTPDIAAATRFWATAVNALPHNEPFPKLVSRATNTTSPPRISRKGVLAGEEVEGQGKLGGR